MLSDDDSMKIVNHMRVVLPELESETPDELLRTRDGTRQEVPIVAQQPPTASKVEMRRRPS